VLLVHHLFGSTAFREASAPVAALTWLLERPLGRVYRGRAGRGDLPQHRGRPRPAGLAPEAIRVDPSGVDLDLLHPRRAAAEGAGADLPLPRPAEAVQGVERILRAAALLRVEGVPLRLVIGGRGDWEPRLRSLAAELGIAAEVEFSASCPRSGSGSCSVRPGPTSSRRPRRGGGSPTSRRRPAAPRPSPATRRGCASRWSTGARGCWSRTATCEALAGAMRRVAASPRLGRRARGRRPRVRAGFTWDARRTRPARHLREPSRPALRPRVARPAAGMAT
jgi:hypothetical protein